MSKIIGVTVGTTLNPEKLKELGDLNLTITDIDESTADGGSNVVTFSDGNTLTVKNGSKGSKGDKGDQGEKGEPGADGKDFEKIILTCSGTTAGSTVTFPSDMTVDALKEAIIGGKVLVSITSMYDTITFVLTTCTDYREMTSSMNYIMAKGSYVPPATNNPTVLYFYIYFDTTTGAVTSISLSSSTTLTHPSIYITSEYTSGIWRVRKWSNNVVELWGRYTATVNISTVWKNNIYYAANAVPQQTFPVTFTAVPKILATANCVDDAYFLVTGSGSVAPTTTKTGQLQVACPLSRTGVGIDISFYVHGTIA